MCGLIAAAVLILFRMPRLGRLVGALAIAQLIAFSLYPVAEALMQPLEDEARAEAAKAPACCYDAIVVLGGSIGPAVPPLRPIPNSTIVPIGYGMPPACSIAAWRRASS